MGLRLRPTVWSGLRGLRDPAQNTQGFVLLVPAVYQGDKRELIAGAFFASLVGRGSRKRCRRREASSIYLPNTVVMPESAPSRGLSWATARCAHGACSLIGRGTCVYPWQIAQPFGSLAPPAPTRPFVFFSFP